MEWDQFALQVVDVLVLGRGFRLRGGQRDAEGLRGRGGLHLDGLGGGGFVGVAGSGVVVVVDGCGRGDGAAG